RCRQGQPEGSLCTASSQVPAPLLPLAGPRIRSGCAQADDWRSAKSVYEFHARDIDGRDVSLEKYRGYVCIITNVASK
uniref:GPX4 peroxidase n=1 Tax=Gopherus agassizii TaxID=38772 RepID=A0A452H7I7_9SAUR